MKDDLAERLLARVMDWETGKLGKERPILQALAGCKYDSYQQFAPGMRFIASLAVWLEQFAPNERETAYNFARERLIFISEQEMTHLVKTAFPDHLRPFLMAKAAADTGISRFAITDLLKSQDYQRLLRQTLYLGMSDGARMDIFRRSGAPSVVHEQVRTSHEISSDRAKSMKRKLAEDLNVDPKSGEAMYRVVVLIDDFTASGITCIRRNNGTITGKIIKVLDSIYQDKGILKESGLVDPSDVQVVVCFYVATEEAMENMESLKNEWAKIEGHNENICCAMALQQLADTIRVNTSEDASMIAIMEKYFDDSIVDEHYRLGKHDKPYLGFNEGALPLVLVHNTPNNSVVVLWKGAPGGRNEGGLFPRVSRHKERLEVVVQDD